MSSLKMADSQTGQDAAIRNNRTEIIEYQGVLATLCYLTLWCPWLVSNYNLFGLYVKQSR